jgi:hypothetical protein
MPEETLKPALRAALRDHEIGSDTPYRLYFAAKGKSGASFGFMQGDLAAGQPEVGTTFRAAMAAASIPAAAIDSLQRRLSVHLLGNPLGVTEQDQVNAALLASRDLVDAMDESILAKVYDGLDTCISKAHAAGSSISPEGQIDIALWINMSGAPTKLLTWLEGGDPGLHTAIPAAGPVVDQTAMETYLRATDYFSENPRNFAQLQASVAAGMADMTPVTAKANLVVADSKMPQNCYIYEQATGRIFIHESGSNDLLATGYSGSDTDGGKNNPHAQCVQDIGPIPRGLYTIGSPFAGPSPFSLRLTPSPTNEMCGRDGFLIHGDAISAPGTASHGCIILERPIRERIDAQRIGPLVVVERLS